MNRWEPHLHWSFEGEHVLLPNLHLRSWATFVISSVLTVAVCVIERCLSVSLDRRWAPPFVVKCTRRFVAWRTIVYGLTVCMRLCYMLIAMTFNMGLILVIVFSLASAQLVLVELQQTPHSAVVGSYASIPLLADGSRHTFKDPRTAGPDSDYTHTSKSNVALADSTALEFGIDSTVSTE